MNLESALMWISQDFTGGLSTLAQIMVWSLLCRPNGRGGVSNHQPHHCLLNRLFRHRSKKTSKLRVAGLCAGNSPVTDEFLAQMASNAEKFSIWWRHHVSSGNKPLLEPMLTKFYNAIWGHKAAKSWCHQDVSPVLYILRSIYTRPYLHRVIVT